VAAAFMVMTESVLMMPLIKVMEESMVMGRVSVTVPASLLITSFPML
jgi:hypothetical protein